MSLPAGTAPYLALYVATLAIHVVLVSYVVVGAAWIAVRGARGLADDRLAATLRDWLPFGVGAAITAGVAPLLFVQLLYQERFYTANLLMNHRWMVVIPALIVGFYATYVAKSARAKTWSPRLRAAAGAVAALCFVFVAWSWTEHHLLSLRDPDEWAAMYGAGRRFHHEASLIPRLVMWLAIAVPVAATVIAWQVRDDAAALRTLRVVAIAGLAAAAGAAALYYVTLTAPARDLIAGGPMTLVVAAVLGVALVAAWLLVPSRPSLVTATSLLTVVAVVAGAIVRERLRLPLLEAARPRVTAAGGAFAFAAFGLINLALIIWCIRSALKHLTRSD